MNDILQNLLIISPYIILALSITLQTWREKRREYWVRKVNTYEHFYRYGNQIIDLLTLFDENFQDWPKFWDFYFRVNDAYYDASFYDRKHLKRVQRIKEVCAEIRDIGRQRLTCKKQILSKVQQEIDEIYNEFKKEEKL